MIEVCETQTSAEHPAFRSPELQTLQTRTWQASDLRKHSSCPFKLLNFNPIG